MSCCSIPAACATWPTRRRSAKWACSARWRSSDRKWCSVFSAAWRRRAAQSLLSGLPHVDLVVGTQKFHRVADYVDELLRENAKRRVDDRDGRSAIFDRRHRGGSWLAGDDSRSHARAAAGDGVRFHHAGLQHALHILHRAADARRGTKPDDRGDRAGSARAGRARGERSDAARPDRESLRPARVSRAERDGQRVRSCNCSKRCTRLTVWSGFVSPRRIRLVFAPTDRCARAICRNLPNTCICPSNPGRTGF